MNFQQPNTTISTRELRLLIEDHLKTGKGNQKTPSVLLKDSKMIKKESKKIK